MALFNITIEKVIVKGDNEEIIKLLKEIKDILTNNAVPQEIIDKLDSAISDIKNTITSLQELDAKVTELQTALDAEQVDIQAAIDALTATVADLQTQVAAGGTEAERQAVIDKINAVITDLQGTIA